MSFRPDLGFIELWRGSKTAAVMLVFIGVVMWTGVAMVFYALAHR